MKQSAPRDGATSPAPLAAGVPAQRRKGERRPEPVLSEAYAHLSVDGLREYRRALSDEEHRVSYWRRILQARLDLVASGTTRKGVDHDRLTPLLTTQRLGAGRRALNSVVHGDGGIPPLPLLQELWERQVEPDDDAGRAAFEDDLRLAEQALSAYRSALHARIGQATGELIARYRDSPELCLSALPLERGTVAARPRD
ncbi:MAG: hypothetical protein AVDCRST_MAG16-3190 [uncultured Frankineae bacterium]|uniref:RsiG-like domain-containing protein n=1 Tax=uncultured Frankineae bacterium TaxID=437475 RepID=A0A6J4MNF1_9ACTN|nr:MAG: hypothetical protein AVDCRST_MAG16-3190 [uncultured Frankineae bacterium]